MYLDPGFGGMLVQLLIAIMVAGSVLLLSFRRKIKALFSKKDNSDISNNKINEATDIKPENDESDIIDVLSENEDDRNGLSDNEPSDMNTTDE